MNILFQTKSIMVRVVTLFAVIILFYFSGCGAVPTSERYGTKETGKEISEVKEKSGTDKSDLAETFDLSPYRPDLQLDDTEFVTESFSEGADAWYEYGDKTESTKNKKIIGTRDGFRVQIIATDNLDDANTMNSEISSLIPNQRSYVNFEPPFYKVKIGDFTEISVANDMRFRLSQMGFTESKVVRESINLFE